MPLKRGQRYSLPKLSSAAHILTLLVLLNWILLGVSGAGAALLQDDKRAVDHPVFTQKKVLCTPIINLLFFLLQILHPDS